MKKAYEARDAGLPVPKAQMLLYPFLDRRLISESCHRYTDTPICNSEDMRKYLSMYVRDLDAAQVQYLSPVEASSLLGLPPAYVEVAQYDCLHDEGVEYTVMLKKCGVPSELHEIKGAMHGYDIAKDSELINEIMEMRLKFLREKIR